MIRAAERGGERRGGNGIKEVQGNSGTLLLETAGSSDVGIDQTVMLGGAHWRLPQQSSAELQLGDGECCALH
jgi:hypothetical protein